MLRLIITFLSAAVLAPAGILAGCGGDEDEEGPRSTAAADVEVVATITQLADMATNVAGDRAEVTGFLSANSDPHDYEPKPSDAEAMTGAAVVLKSGGDLDTWADQIIDSSGTDGDVITILDSIDTRELDEGADPHWWQNPANGVIAVEQIRDALSEVDPEGADTYEENASAYIDQIEELDQAIGECMSGIPDDERKLVTTHDALGYYADRFGIEVVGAAIPALTTQAQPSTGDTAELMALIEDEGVHAIFTEAGLNPDLEEAIADQADAAVGEELFADTLGADGSGGETYLGALALNTQRLADGFTAGEVSCDDLPSD